MRKKDCLMRRVVMLATVVAVGNCTENTEVIDSHHVITDQEKSQST
jgi:hypothetical protein